MNTFIVIVVVIFLLFMMYSMFKYASFIHNYPKEMEHRQKQEEDTSTEKGDDPKLKG